MDPMERKPPISGIAQIMFLLLFLVAPFISSYGQRMGAVGNYAMNRPGVVMMKTVFSANVYVNQMKMDNKRFNHLLDSVQRLDTSGVIYSAEQKLDIVLRQMNNSPNRF